MTANRILYFSITAASIAYFYNFYTSTTNKWSFLESAENGGGGESSSSSLSLEQIILDRWKEIIEKPNRPFERILVGINSNVDLIVSGTKLLSRMNIVLKSPSTPIDHENIDSLDQFGETFGLFFSRGAPGERYTSNERLFSDLVRAAEMEKEKSEFAIGGNAALIADKIASISEDFSTTTTKSKVFLVGPIGPRLKTLLNPNILIPPPDNQPNQQMTAKDEIHLILEFKQGDRWGDFVAQTSSRFITSHDAFSSSEAVIQMFFDSIISYKPDMVVLSGLHLLEFQSHEVRMQKLSSIQRGLRKISTDIPIHLELGSMADVEFGRRVLETIVPYVDSLGLNEQEMIFVSRSGDGPFADQFPVRATSIGARKAGQIMKWLLTTFGRLNTDHHDHRNYRLGRIHFHCLTYHMSATTGGGQSGGWSNCAAALAAGARLAGKQACDGKDHDPATADLIDPTSVELRLAGQIILDNDGQRDVTFSPQQGVSSWTRDQLHFIYTPVLVCKNPRKTVGLGDAISATGLMYSQFGGGRS